MVSDSRGSPASLDQARPDSDELLADVLRGLSEPPYALSPKYLYDQRGSELFDRICDLEAYYPTRTELSILEESGGEIASAVGGEALVVELGSGSSNKTRALLDRLPQPAAYVPVDISREHLEAAAARIDGIYPELEVLPVAADYTRPFPLPRPTCPAERTLLYFPGSTLGNFDLPDAEDFLARQAEQAGSGGGMVLGLDLQKDVDVLLRAYDDPEGITAAFNRNLLQRLRKELGADLDIEAFAHRARFNEELGCVEMHLESLTDQEVRIGGHAIPFQTGQTIRTERSYKYTLDGFRTLAERAGFRVAQVWTDPAAYFSVQYLEVV
ncbi:L-histidine N(alpha)-methyltransferase [Thiohalorhabdus methylotrophus]|uniref:L-histidine N(Alpha)-methyltransferase n=1 Tax=Thiohalorhabdus methylotrophus TaxID=3242694 RepID=A0ABV4TXH2_9GAMM